jgi:uncharacterized membrane protein YjgN (DUF898 family)
MDTIAAENTTTLPFNFTGKTGEYFRIWIVNVMLTIATLGVYSAWAKVRNKRYFYGNTSVDGTAFDYHADPVAILKGRLIAVGVLAVYSVTVQFLPAAEPGFWILFLIGLPWLVVRALAFNARNSSWRNIRFDFSSNYREAIKVFIGMPILVVLTLGLAYPYFMYRQKAFVINNSEYGTTDFDFGAESGAFYSIYMKASGILIAIVLLYLFVIPAIIPAAGATEQAPPAPPSAEMIMLVLLPLVIIMPVYMLFMTYIQTATTNLVFNSSRLQHHTMNSTLHTGRMFWIHVSNLFAIFCTLGLLIPWARVRMARYRAENLTLNAHGKLDEFVAGEQDRVRATGEEIAEVFDVDLGL